MAAIGQSITISMNLRPCYAYGKKALFHKWVDKEKTILLFPEIMSKEQIIELLNFFKKNNAVPKNCEIKKVKTTVAIVEYEDGSIGEVKPFEIEFLDNEINEYAFPQLEKDG